MVGFRFDTLNKHFSNMGLLNGSGTLGKKPDTDGAKYLQEDYEKYITQLQQKSGFIVVTPDDFEGRKPNVDEIKSLAIKHIENLEAELNECKMLNNQLMSDLDADEGLAEICVNEFIADTIKAVKDAGVKKITVEF